MTLDKLQAILIGSFVSMVVVILALITLTALCSAALNIVPESSRAEGYLTMICWALV